MSLSESRSELVLELAEEFLDRYRKGERPPLKEYIERHPELAAEIKEVLRLGSPGRGFRHGWFSLAVRAFAFLRSSTHSKTPIPGFPPFQRTVVSSWPRPRTSSNVAGIRRRIPYFSQSSAIVRTVRRFGGFYPPFVLSFRLSSQPHGLAQQKRL